MMGYYGYTGIGYEIDKNAAWDYIRDGYLLSPRTVLKGRTKSPQFAIPVIEIDSNKILSKVQEALMAVMGKLAGSRCAVMFSGGFDSILIGLLARQCGVQVTAVTVQFDDFNLLTIEGAKKFAKKVGITHHILHVKTVEFLSAFEELSSFTDEPMLDLDLGVVYAALKKYDPGVAGEVFISGVGSDQWFGNESLEVKTGELEAQLDWAMVNENAHQRMAQVLGYRFVFPFLSGPLLALSQSVPAAMKKNKKLLRMLAVANKIPYQGSRSEIQVPSLLRYIFMKTYGERAWPCPVSAQSKNSRVDDEALRQIILGLWLEKVRELKREG